MSKTNLYAPIVFAPIPARNPNRTAGAVTPSPHDPTP